MTVHVHDRLSRRSSTVHTYIVSIRLVTLFKPTLSSLDQIHDRLLFSRGKIKPICGMAIGDDQQVALGDRKTIQADMSQRIGWHCPMF